MCVCVCAGVCVCQECVRVISDEWILATNKLTNYYARVVYVRRGDLLPHIYGVYTDSTRIECNKSGTYVHLDWKLFARLPKEA